MRRGGSRIYDGVQKEGVVTEGLKKIRRGESRRQVKR